MTERGELTGLQRAFVDAWFACRFNGTEAAREAGYHGDDATLAVTASENLRKPKIKAEIARRWEAHGITAEEVLARWVAQARGDMGDFLLIEPDPACTGDDPDEKQRPALDLAQAKERGVLHLIKSIAWTRHGPRLELYSAKDALDSIARSLGMFKDQATHLNVDLGSLTNEQLERIAAGEEPAHVLASTSRGGAGAPPAPQPDSG